MATASPLTVARLKELFIYDPLTGLFTRRVNCGRAKKGEIAGTVGSHGYLQISIDNTIYLAQRLAWFHENGEWPQNHTDHLDGDKLNNRIENLREATASQNLFNTPSRKNNTSGQKGVYWSKRRRRWIAQICVARKVINLGGFESKDEAKAARLEAEKKIAGEFSWQTT